MNSAWVAPVSIFIALIKRRLISSNFLFSAEAWGMVCEIYAPPPWATCRGGAPVLVEPAPVLVDAGEYHTSVVHQRIDVKNLSGDEAGQHMIRSALAQRLTLVQFF